MPLLVESHRIVFVKFPGPGKSWKNEFAPGKSCNLQLGSKLLELEKLLNFFLQ